MSNGHPCRWVIPTLDEGEASSLASTLGICAPAACVLLARGYADPDAARRFLNPSLEDLHDPFLMLGMREALHRLRRAIDQRESILLYGDYDVDGATSVVILKKAIELAGGNASYYVPNRLKDGYGMRAEVIEDAAARGVSLIVSVDTGIRAAEVVCRARQIGLDVIVTDHHLPDANLPAANSVLNPKQPGCPYPEKDLCGAGVAFKLVQALIGSLNFPAARVRSLMESFIKPVAIATVADVVPLTGENRILVRHGLDGLTRVRNPGLRQLLKVAGFIDGDKPSAGHVAFRIAPRMNAAGRLADANEVIELLLTGDEVRACEIAERLNALNQERQQTEAEIMAWIREECLRTPVTDDCAALVFAGRDWHKGVVGIVASRVVELFHRPAFVLSEDRELGLLQGSGRSVPGFHLLHALESMPELFTKFGGHKQAAGLTLPSACLDQFRSRMNEYALARLAPGDFSRRLEIDAQLDFGEVSDRSIEELLCLAPFGCGNPAPIFAVNGVQVAGQPLVRKEKHLQLHLRQNGRTLTAKAWNLAERKDELAPGACVDVALAFEPDEYARSRGYPGWCAVLKDFRSVSS